MINVACYTLKEVDDILKMTEAVGFECANHTKPTSFIGSKIYEDGAIVSLEFNPQQIVRIYSVEKGKRIDVSANELLMLVSGNSDEMTAREFIEFAADTITSSKCNRRECLKCVFSEKNTKCNRSLCNINNWKDNIDEILEIAKSGRSTVLTPEKKAINTLEKFIKNPDCAVLNEEFIESLKLAIEKLKEVE